MYSLLQKAHIEERFILINKNLEQIQEEIRLKVTEYVRCEQTCQKQQTEIKTLKDRTRSYEDELSDLKKFIDKVKKDLQLSKEECLNLQQENSKYKSNTYKMQHELDTRKEQERLFVEQLDHNENLLQQLQNELRYLILREKNRN